MILQSVWLSLWLWSFGGARRKCSSCRRDRRVLPGSNAAEEDGLDAGYKTGIHLSPAAWHVTVVNDGEVVAAVLKDNEMKIQIWLQISSRLPISSTTW